MPIEKYWTVERSLKLLNAIAEKVKPFSITDTELTHQTGRKACIYAECVAEAVREDAERNRTPRPPKKVA